MKSVLVKFQGKAKVGMHNLLYFSFFSFNFRFIYKSKRRKPGP